jgi:hypothetical protein
VAGEGRAESAPDSLSPWERIGSAVAFARTAPLASAEDIGPLALDFPAGVDLAIRVVREATCKGGTMPADANVIVQYRVKSPEITLTSAVADLTSGQ